jgi:hypothetical protein
MKKIVLLIITAIAMSCNENKLSNTEALDIIKADYKDYCSIGYVGRWPDKRTWAKLDNLKKQGLITIQSKRNTDIWKKEYKIITLTAKGQSYFDDAPNKQNGKRVIIAKFEPVEIIGISYLENKAQVKFKTRLTKTPFYELIGIYNKPRCVFDIEKNTTKEETVTLIKYDTGWQINKK